MFFSGRPGGRPLQKTIKLIVGAIHESPFLHTIVVYFRDVVGAIPYRLVFKHENLFVFHGGTKAPPYKKQQNLLVGDGAFDVPRWLTKTTTYSGYVCVERSFLGDETPPADFNKKGLSQKI